MGRKLRRPKEQARPASVYLRYVLALGAPPTARLRGWVAACATGGADNRRRAELVATHGDAIREECRRAGFAPSFDRQLSEQSEAARSAAQSWAAAVVREGAY